MGNLPLDNIPEHKRAMLQQLIQELSPIPGIAAIVLGGSYASGTQQADSDIDLGLYYHENSPFSIPAVSQVAQKISSVRQATVTGFYEWGAWVNGGAWIHTAHGKVDFLYRNLNQVQRVLSEAQQGRLQHDFDQQPTHGFYSVTYLAETHICVPLYDPEGRIAALKQQVVNYPPRLKQQVIADSLWAAEFTLLHAHSFAAEGDIYNTVGCLTRAAANLTQALFALNEVYFLRYKKVTQVIAAFPKLPSGYIERINRVLSNPGSTAQELAGAVDALEQAWHSVVSLPGVQYEPKFKV
jgi:predicted nucleotidyltransferase